MEDEDRFKSIVEVLLEWTGWGGFISAVVTVLLVAVLGSVSLDNEAAAIIIMTAFLGVTSWGTSRLIREREGEWKKYFNTWLGLVLIASVLLVLAILFVPT